MTVTAAMVVTGAMFAMGGTAAATTGRIAGATATTEIVKAGREIAT
jgi:hypothetical protein